MAVRFMRRGITQIHNVPTITNLAAPTVAEVVSGTELVDINAVEGFTWSNEAIDTPDLKDTFKTTIPGEDSGADSSITFYELSDGTGYWTALSKGTETNIVIARYGGTDTNKALKIGDKVDVFPVQVGSIASQISTGNEPALYTVSFAITAPPKQNVALA